MTNNGVLVPAKSIRDMDGVLGVAPDTIVLGLTVRGLTMTCKIESDTGSGPSCSRIKLFFWRDNNNNNNNNKPQRGKVACKMEKGKWWGRSI
jgi:hypothetical protein